MARRTENTTGTDREPSNGASGPGPVDGFRGAQVCAVVGITYRQLDYWARTGLLRPSLVDATGSGSKRRYSYGDVLELKVIKRLLDAGLKLQQARQAVECLRGDLGVDLASAQLVLADNRSILATSGGDLVDLLAGGQGVFNVLPLSGVVSELDAAIVELTAPTPDEHAPDERHPAAAYLAAGGNARR
ncbi:MAG: MerR family transcriptional regulator [Acidimicrobiales bacterium]|jgi:DNA-binding transcriptional MerR regulator